MGLVRYIDMKIVAGAALADRPTYNEQVHGAFARLAAEGYVFQVSGPAERKVQEIAGLLTPVAFIPRKTGEMACDVLIREDIFDAAVLVALERHNQLLRELEEAFLAAQHRAVVPIGETDSGNSGQEGSIYSDGGGTPDAKEDQLQGAPC